MYLAMFFIPLIMWFLIAYIFNKKDVFDLDYDNAMAVSVIISCVLFVIILFVNLISFSIQKSDYIEVTRLLESKEILQKKAEIMTMKYKEILIEKYPTYEKDILAKMTPEDYKILMVKYPEIKASLTSINFVEKIEGLNNDVYDTDLKIRETIADIRFRFVNPWIIDWMVPKLPDLLISTYYSKYYN